MYFIPVLNFRYFGFVYKHHIALKYFYHEREMTTEEETLEFRRKQEIAALQVNSMS